MLDEKSLINLNKSHPLLQKLMLAADEKCRKELGFDLCILDSLRGKAAQEKAFKEGNSKARFGESAHNYFPAIANDVVPDYDPDFLKRKIRWEAVPDFLKLNKLIGQYDPAQVSKGYGLAKALRIPITWGGDWDGDGDRFDQKLIDLPHYELRPWRLWAKDSTLYTG